MNDFKNRTLAVVLEVDIEKFADLKCIQQSATRLNCSHVDVYKTDSMSQDNSPKIYFFLKYNA